MEDVEILNVSADDSELQSRIDRLKLNRYAVGKDPERRIDILQDHCHALISCSRAWASTRTDGQKLETRTYIIVTRWRNRRDAEGFKDPTQGNQCGERFRDCRLPNNVWQKEFLDELQDVEQRGAHRTSFSVDLEAYPVAACRGPGKPKPLGDNPFKRNSRESGSAEGGCTSVKSYLDTDDGEDCDWEFLDEIEYPNGYPSQV